MERGRKPRKDKKRSIAAPLDSDTLDVISRLSYVLDLPQKRIGEVLCINGYKSSKMFDSFKMYFKRNIQYENRFIFANPEAERYKILYNASDRLYIRLGGEDYNAIASMAYALDSKVGPTAALLIRTAIMRKDIMYEILSRYIQKDLDPHRTEQLRKVCRHLEFNSPDAHITMPMVIAHAIEQSLLEEKPLSITLMLLDKFAT